MKKKKNTALQISIGFIIDGILLILWAWFLITLPDPEEELKYSPFENEGTWQCKETGFIIISSINEESGRDIEGFIDNNGTIIEVDIYCMGNRGFVHNYAVTIFIYTENPDRKISCYGEFKEQQFKLFIISNDEFWNGKFKTLTFDKIS